MHRLVSLLVLAGCEGGATDLVVHACQPVEVDVDGEGSWRVEGAVLFDVQAGPEGVHFIAPSVARPTEIRLVGPSEEHSILVEPVGATPEGLADDCAPFPRGVASGEPDTHSVLLWSFVDHSARVRWQVSPTASFERVVAESEVDADGSLRVEASGLEPATTYYYRFFADGRSSRVGRTRTAPIDATEARFAFTSCSSLFSGYFNAYRRIAEQDLDFVLHLGDFVYDRVDPQERVRVPQPEPSAPSNLEEWRARYALYLRDPDLRAARAAHPWVAIWDDHELSGDPVAGVQAFRENVPMRLEDSVPPEQAYRSFRWGTLIDLLVLDVTHHREQDREPPSMLGAAQMRWLETAVQGGGRWRLVASQKLFAPLAGVASFADDTWSGFPASREEVLELLNDAVPHTLVLSGDLHFNVFAETPGADYDASSGRGARLPEVLSASLTRGNVDESVPNERLRSGLLQAYREANPHVRDVDLTQHGYVVVEVSDAQIVAQSHFSSVLDPSRTETLGREQGLDYGRTHWSR